LHTSLIDHSTYTTFGHDEEVPWLDMHSVGNKPRDHGFYGAMDTLFSLDPPTRLLILSLIIPVGIMKSTNRVAKHRHLTPTATIILPGRKCTDRCFQVDWPDMCMEPPHMM